MPAGPSTWDELYAGGVAIFEKYGVPVGIGLSPELDSRMATHAVIWSHGGSVQDENETVAAVEFYAKLQNDAMTEEVFGWAAPSNNQGLIAGELSYILNSISAYRHGGQGCQGRAERRSSGGRGACPRGGDLRRLARARLTALRRAVGTACVGDGRRLGHAATGTRGRAKPAGRPRAPYLELASGGGPGRRFQPAEERA